jgi:hypothetical protein
MARTRKSIQPLNLYKYDVLIEDKATRSDYFKVTQFDGNFYGGRNAFLLAGTGVLRPNSKILVEILNKDGTTVYSAPITSFIEGNSRLVQIEVYSDTPIGPGKIVLLGCADTYLDGTPVPEIWQGKYNVRWVTDVVISPLIENKTPIRFQATPSIVATEKFYYTPSSSQFVEQIKVPVDIELTPKYYNVFPNGYLAKIRGPNSTKYNSDYLGGAITGTIALSNGNISTTASINIPITKIYNSTLGESQGTLIYINDTLFSKGILSSSGAYTTQIEPFGLATVSSSINIQYNKLTTFNTGSAVSFAKLRLVDLKTISGEIHKIRLSYKATTEPGEFVSLGDINTSVAELLTVDSSSRIAETGQFTDIKINDYWYSETMSLQKNEATPTLPTYYISSSLSSSYLPIVQSSATVLDSITATPQIVNNTYINSASYFIGTKNTNTIQVFPRVEYALTFDAAVSRTSASITLTQNDYSLEVYLVAEAGYPTKLLDTNPRGQLLGTLTPTATFQRQNFDGTEFNFIPKIIATGNFGLRFIAYGGFWNIANVSVKAAQEPFFSPDEIDILISNVNYVDKILTFKAEYLDVNNNSIGLSTLSLPTYFTGSEALQGSAGSSVSASYALTSSAATSITFTPLTASYALTAGAAGGGVTGTGTVGRFTIWNGTNAISASSLIDAGTSITSSVPITGSISNAVTASYVTASNIRGTVTSASYAATSSNITGGVANYIPLWGSATALSSSTIYQSAGNIGIGTTSPSGLLTIYSGSTGGLGGHIVLNNNGLAVANETALIFGDGASTAYRAVIATITENAPYYGAIAFRTGIGTYSAITEKMRITGTGNVGIGTTSPSNNSKLDVSLGKIRAGTITSTNGSTIIEGAYTDGAITTLGTEYSSGGPVLAYGVTPSTASADSFFSSTGINANRGAYVMAGGVHKWSSATAASIVAVGTVVSLTETMRLTAAGNLGIGTASPAYKLDVSGSIGLSGFLFALKSGNYTQIFEPAANTAIYLGNATDPSNYYDNTAHWWRTRGGGTVNMYLNSVGLGIGTFTPLAKLDVRGSVLVGTGSATNTMGATNYIAISTPTIGQSTGLEFYGAAPPYNPRAWITHTHTVSSQALTFNSIYSTGTGYANFIFLNGNVGIGTSTPGVTLDVASGVSRFGGSGGVHTGIAAAFLAGQAELYTVGSVPLGIGTTGTQPIRLYTGGSLRATLDTSGNLGIGTTSPSATLHVVGDVSASILHISGTLGQAITQTSSSIGIGDYIYDTGITITSLVPDGPSVYELIAQYNPNTSGAGQYRNIIHGHIYIEDGFDGIQNIVTAEYNELFRAIGSGSYDASGANVNISFVNTTNAAVSTERTTVPYASGSWQMRIRFSNNSTPPGTPSYRVVRLLRKL